MIDKKNVLSVENLEVGFQVGANLLKAVDNLSLELKSGEILGIVGESGCGKSVTSLAIMGLLPKPNGKILNGKIFFNGEEISTLSESKLRKLRGEKMAMIFQDPMSSLNPVFTCENQILEILDVHRPTWSTQQKKQRMIELFDMVGIPEPKIRAKSFPHQLSGGMRQRVMIAMALACDPQLLIADEPTTALDVTIQAQILELIQSLVKESSSSMILITHDMGIVAEACDNVGVMYAGQIIEYGSIEQVFNNPKHQYTYGLLNSIPYHRTTGSNAKIKASRLATIPGTVPPLDNLPNGCRFQDRCRSRQEDCAMKLPEKVFFEPVHFARCLHPVQSSELAKDGETL